jgi:phosphatidylinositol phospholipase C delta
VWDGEAPVTGASQRPHLPNSLSSHSVTSSAASLLDKVKKEAKEKFEHGKELGKKIIGEKTGHSRTTSMNSEADLPQDMQRVSKTDSTAVVEGLDKAPSPHSHSHSRSNSSSNMRPEPRVLHGWTLTSEVSFRDVCKTVRETAFVTTDLPLIVSLEVHANLEQQEIMVEIMKEEWKGLLLDEAHETCNPAERLPRLDELYNKVSLLLQGWSASRDVIL